MLEWRMLYRERYRSGFFEFLKLRTGRRQNRSIGAIGGKKAMRAMPERRARLRDEVKRLREMSWIR